MTFPKDFGHTDEHDLVRSSARRFLNERATAEERRRLLEADGWDAALLREMAELGWLGLSLPDDVGGAGLRALHLCLLLEEHGRALLPSPLLPMTLAGLAIDRAGDRAQRERWCGAIARGELVATLAVDAGTGAWAPDAVAGRARADGEGYAIDATLPHVIGGADAGLVVAPLAVGDEVALFAFEVPPGAARRELAVDLTRPLARLELEGARGERLGRGPAPMEAIHRMARTLLAAEMVGGAERVLVTTRDYANERVQFDRRIGSFQAVKHPLVDMMIAVEQARSLTYAAAAALDAASEDAERLSRMAKASASDAFAFAVRKAVQLHGGMGFTWECDVHLWFRRAQWARATLGDATHHRRHLAELLVREAG